MLTLLIDNYDSYTFNLFQALAEVNGEEPIVVRHDGHEWAELASWRVDNIVLSPGPGHPGRPRDFGVCADAIAGARVPLLGVCLGHQGIAAAAGARVDRAPRVMHGRHSRVRHDGSALFAGLPQGFAAVRYHSLAVLGELPRTLIATAWSDDGVLMGLRERARPVHGVQFHPESIGTEHGDALLRNFRDLTRAARPRPVGPSPRRAAAATVVPRRRAPARRPREMARLHVRRLDHPVDAEAAFFALHADVPHAFWLDSSDARPGLGRISYLGAAARTIRVDAADDDAFAALREELARLRAAPPPGRLPFAFTGGLAGYLGYELRGLTAGPSAQRSPWPDAELLVVDRLLAIDHEQGAAYLVARGGTREGVSAGAWLDATARRLRTLPPEAGAALVAGAAPPVPFTLHRSRADYLAAIAAAQRSIAAGETYEVCLTNELRSPVRPDPLALHRALRTRSPAPFGAFLRLGERAVVSSSPERYLRVERDGRVEARPIKGTAPRDPDPRRDAELRERLAASEKERAENLMIADLVRNDLGIVCEVGSVAVPQLIGAESYEAVHQLVSVVTGRLRAGLDALDAIRASFPGGSMTGAPKRRTIEIIEALERRPRGVYSGAIGWLGADGAADLSIAIRTVTLDRDGVRVGAGGAIVAQSDPRAELEELLLKARAPIEAVALAAGRTAVAVRDA